MGFNAQEKQELASIVRSVINENHNCQYQEQLSQLIWRLEALGNGDVKHGIESFYKTLDLMTRVRKFGEKVGGRIALMLVLSVAGGVGTVLVIGAKALLERLK